jgi:hypothetical protein
MVVKKEQGLKSSPAEAGGFNQKRDYKIINQATLKEVLAHSYCQSLKLQSADYQLRAELCLCRVALPKLQEQMVEFLHREELDYYATLVFEKRQHSYLLGRYAAKQAIGRYDTNVTYSDVLIKPGVFKYPVVYEVAARTGINPKTKEPLEIAAYKQVRFKVGSSLKMAANDKSAPGSSKETKGNDTSKTAKKGKAGGADTRNKQK